MTGPKPPADPPASGIRLQKVLAQAGVSSRRGGEALITAGRVTVNGQVVTTLGTRVDPAHDEVAVDGKAVVAEAPVYVLLHKPDNVVCAAGGPVDERGRPTVLSLCRGIRERIYPVGRLDFNTRGVLLLTNDGAMASGLTHPRSKVQKTYHAKFQGRLTATDLETLLGGVTLEDGTKTLPLSELSVVRETETNTWVQLTLTQGLNRQVRRMGEAIGHPVLKLLRVAFAGLTADELEEGKWRHLRPSEVDRLWTLLGAGPAKRGKRRRGGGRGAHKSRSGRG